ncbi:MAG: hypothetical protein J5796_02425 [Erysipelotrichaceae bacterium]|nr:hypothetical protein [Erysipelotrichaceae bacterium]
MLTLLFLIFALTVAFNVIGLVLGITFSVIGLIVKLCFYLSPFGFLYLLLRYWSRRCW